MREAFLTWIDHQPLKDSTKNTIRFDLNRLERRYGDLDAAFDLDHFGSIMADLKYSKDDERSGRPNPSKIEIDGNIYSGLASYRAKLTYYSRFRDAENIEVARRPLNQLALQELKARFLEIFPDFDHLGFEANHGGYWDEERGYKDKVMADVREILSQSTASAEEVGRKFLDLMQRPPANFVGWRTIVEIKDAGPAAERAIAIAIGEMLTSEDEVSSLASVCAATIHPLLMSGTLGRPAYASVRTLVTTALALARPQEAFAVKTRIMNRWAKKLTGGIIVKAEVMTRAEYEGVLTLAESLEKVMRDDWGWTPQDLWDVQGFLWATSELELKKQPDDEAENGERMRPEFESKVGLPPTNLIYFGPPGTGKTYVTAKMAVQVCDGEIPSSGRPDVMKRYSELVASGRVGFVTFHQSFAYEDFVEGLRPVVEPSAESSANSEEGRESAGGATVGFSLKPHDGVFKRIARVAKANRGRAPSPIDTNHTQRAFKMSLGRSWSDESVRLFNASLEGGYVALGWGGDIDWSAPQYDNFSAVRDRWQEDHPGVTGYDSNIKQLWALRSGMQVGDLVIVSDGNEKFRAIGRVSGPYQFVFDEEDEYHHRRPVDWLWHSEQSLPRDLIYGRSFMMAAAYQLDSAQINWPALEQIISSAGSNTNGGANPEPFVLIIDEINRANISKVFGELITLLEPDKRLGAANELTVTLPYSGEAFGVPSNLHIIGTMNTADRSIALLDTALRRRFEFIELMPDPEVLAEAKSKTGIDLVAALKGLNARIEYFFDRDHQIGHAYFMDCKSKMEVDQVMRTKVIPLLAEYFYENWEKVRLVLGETTDAGAFVGRTALTAPRGADDFASGEERWRYFVQPEFQNGAYDQLKR